MQCRPDSYLNSYSSDYQEDGNSDFSHTASLHDTAAISKVTLSITGAAGNPSFPNLSKEEWNGEQSWTNRFSASSP